ncbi:hypothetical protein SapgrDRAFT_3479 [Saprospira grandis DSM 2844]|uniref:Uncharacterized protein n=1 Tax=Saprospira grandis DSM 2844 TaxID=694433 RepID=J1I8F7_9BACT|nr:hypothetical protein [Saprospira grandis]EJF55115.1 hypothetical protein SapgrDRAFT_3479 [Saprospira grandis DSM 2844]
MIPNREFIFKIGHFFFKKNEQKVKIIFWGLPALWAGRAVSGLAGLLGPAQNSLRSFCWVCGFAAPFSIPKPRPFGPVGTQKFNKKLGAKKE